jgi:hypothetical protein
MGEEADDEAVAVADAPDACWAWSATSAMVSPAKLASSAPLRLAHRYSAGLSSGA